VSDERISPTYNSLIEYRGQNPRSIMHFAGLEVRREESRCLSLARGVKDDAPDLPRYPMGKEKRDSLERYKGMRCLSAHPRMGDDFGMQLE